MWSETGLGVCCAWAVGAVLAAAASEGSAGAAELPADHPRIFVKKSELPELVKRCSAGGPAAAEYAELRRHIDGFVNGRRAMGGGDLPGLCIVYQVEKTSGRDGSKYVDYLKKGLWGTDGKGGGSKLAGRRHWYPTGTASIFAGYMGGNGCWFAWDAMCYDWFYDALTPGERAKYGDLLGRWLHSFQGLKPKQPARITYRWGSALYNQTWAPCEGYAWGNYYGRDAIGPKTLVSIAIKGSPTRYEKSAAEWLASFEKEGPGRITSAIERQGGVWTAGPGHGGAAAQAAMLTFEAWRVATGQDLFKGFRERGMRRLGYWPLYAEMPHSGSWPHIDDTGGGMVHGVRGAASRIEPLLARTYRQPVLQWAALNMMKTPKERSWPYVLWYDPGVPAAKAAELPLAFHFEGVGHVYARSAWENPDATWSVFDCGTHFAGYQSDDNGHFMIYKGGGLAMRGGTDRYSGTRSPSHNVVLVYDPSDDPPDGGVLKGAGYKDEGVPRGKMVAFGASKEFTYACGDLTGAYSRKKMRSYQRHFLYLRAEPECFVVYDRVVATGAAYPKMWLLHVMNEPRITKAGSDAPQTSSGAGHKVYAEAGGAIASAFAPQNNPRKNGRGRFGSTGLGAMRVVTLLPAKARITSRGGKGHDNWGCPHDPKSNKNFGQGRGEGGNLIDRSWYRIEVEPQEKSAATEFLHVLVPRLMPRGSEKTAAQLAPSDFASAKLVGQSSSEVEVVISGRGGEWRVKLPRTGAPGGSAERGGRSWELPTKNMPNGTPPAASAAASRPSPGRGRPGGQASAGSTAKGRGGSGRLAEARKLALAGEFEAAAKLLEAEPGAAGVRSAYLAVPKMRGWVIEGVRGGRMARAYVELFGRPARVRITSADEEGLRVEFSGSTVPLPWKKIPARRLPGIFRRYCPDGEAPRKLLGDLTEGLGLDERR